MSDARRFIGGRRLAGFDLVLIAGATVISAYPRLRACLNDRCGSDVGRLFAEPIVSGGNGAAPARIDWYSDRDGPVIALSDLPAHEAEAVLAKAREQIDRVRPILADPEMGAVIAAAFNVAGPGALLSIGGEPVFIDWGMLPSGLMEDDAARLRHHESVLRELRGLPVPPPPVTERDWARVHAPSSTVSARASAAHVPRYVGIAGSSGRLAAFGFLLVAALLLAGSFWPGLLRYPDEAAVTRAEALATSLLDGLERRRTALSAAADLDCERLGTDLPRLVPQAPRAILPAPSSSAVEPAALFDPGGMNGARADTGAPAPAAGGDLAARLAAATVLVITENGTGSGFFVAPDLVVTNRHVVGGGRRVLIAGPTISIVPSGEVVSGADENLADFALIRVPPQTNVAVLPLASPPAALTPVVATGYPGFHLQTDPVFGRLKDGDASAARQLSPVFGTGVINHLQRYDERGVTLVLHGAEIAPGNSGGPLTDYCGRVIGVNTFLRIDPALPVTARYALGSDGLMAFLRAQGVALAPAGGGCDLRGAPLASPAAPAATRAPPPVTTAPGATRP